MCCQARAKGGKVDVMEPENVPVDSGPVPFLRVQGHIFGLRYEKAFRPTNGVAHDIF